MDSSTLAAFEAASETIMPGSSDAGTHQRVASLFEGAMPGFSMMVEGLLDAYAAEIVPSTSFADLTIEQRTEVFRKMTAEESQDIRDVVDGLFLFTLGQTYSEAHPDHRAIWARIGYHGPSEGSPDA